MLYTNNVLTEIFAEKMAPALVPVANAYDIGEVLWQVSDENRRYRDDETQTANVPEDWHKAVLLEFAEWLADHIPDGDEISLCRKYKDIPMIRQLIRYQAEELMEVLEPLINEIPLEEANGIAATANTMTDLICLMDGEKIVNVATGDGDTIELFVPDYSEMPVEMVELPEYLVDNIDAQSAAWYECRLALLYAITAAAMSDQACISVCSTTEEDGGKCSIALLALVNGQVVMVTPDNMDVFFEEAESGGLLVAQENLSGNVAHSEVEYRAMVLASQITLATMHAIDSGREFFRDLESLANGKKAAEEGVDAEGASDDGERTCDITFSMYSTPLVTDSEEGVNVFSVPEELFYGDYMEFYDGALAVDPTVSEEDALRLLLAFVVEKTAEEILWYGRSEEAAENIADMFQSLELDRTMDEMLREREQGDDDSKKADAMSDEENPYDNDEFASLDFGETVEDFLAKIPIRHEGEEGYDIHGAGLDTDAKVRGDDPRAALLDEEYDESRMLREFADSVSERKELALSDSIYEELDDRKQAMIRALLRPVFDYPEKVHAILSVGKTPNESGELTPLLTTVPPNISPYAKDDMMSAARSVITKAMLSGDSYTFISTLDPEQPYVTFISMLEWADGQWRNKDIDALCDYLEEVPVDSALMLHPGDGLVFRKMNVDGTFEDVYE